MHCTQLNRVNFIVENSTSTPLEQVNYKVLIIISCNTELEDTF